MKFSKSYRKLLATTATTALVAAALTPVASADTSFTDVSSRYDAAVQFLVSKGALSGTESKFNPNATITQQDAAFFFARVLGAPIENSPEAIAATLKAAGLADATLFEPTKTITRGQVAILLQKAFKLTGDAELTFTDVTKDYEAAVKALVANNITKGQSAEKFGLDDPAKRGEVALFLYLASQVPAIETFDLTIMHTNDTHANVQHLAKKVTAVKEVRASKPNSLLLDAGDVFSGTLYFNEFQGQADLAFMNEMGYDAMTFGNHEFDLGSSKEGHKALADFVKGAKFPFVSANVNFTKDSLFQGLQSKGTVSAEKKDSQIFDGLIKTVDGEKIGIFGLTTEETVEISSPGKVEFSNYLKEAERMVEYFKSNGVNKIIALTHLGYDDNVQFDNDLELAKKVEGIDVIVGGHTHTTLAEPVVVPEGAEPTIIVQAGQYSEALGTLDVQFDDNGKVVGQAGKLIKISEKAEDAKAVELLKPFKEQVEKVQTQSIGVKIDKALDGERANVRTKETNLGNLITDGMLWKAKTINKDAVIAVQNGGGIRASIPAGDMTLGKILTVMPFGNALGIMNLTGAEIKAALEHSVSQAPEQSGGFLQVSGLTFTYDSSKEAGKRVVSVEVKEADGKFVALDDKKSYVVATNTFTAKGGDGYDVFKKAYEDGRVSEPGYVDYEMFSDYLKSLTKVEPKVEERIVDVNKK